MRLYKWVKYGFKITVKIEIPASTQVIINTLGEIYGKVNSDCMHDFNYLGSFDDLYIDENRFMHSSLLTLILADIKHINYLKWLSTRT